jgi:hypothetical protein
LEAAQDEKAAEDKSGGDQHIIVHFRE